MFVLEKITSSVYGVDNPPIDWADISLLVPHEAIRREMTRMCLSINKLNESRGEAWQVVYFCEWFTDQFAAMVHEHHDNEEVIYFPWIATKVELPDKKLSEGHKELIAQIRRFVIYAKRLLRKKEKAAPKSSRSCRSWLMSWNRSWMVRLACLSSFVSNNLTFWICSFIFLLTHIISLLYSSNQNTSRKKRRIFHLFFERTFPRRKKMLLFKRLELAEASPVCASYFHTLQWPCKNGQRPNSTTTSSHRYLHPCDTYCLHIIFPTWRIVSYPSAMRHFWRRNPHWTASSVASCLFVVLVSFRSLSGDTHTWVVPKTCSIKYACALTKVILCASEKHKPARFRAIRRFTL